jgi:hypothetical protein
MVDHAKEFIERAEELWLDHDSISDESKAKQFDALLMDFCVLVGMLKVYHQITQEPTNG